MEWQGVLTYEFFLLGGWERRACYKSACAYKLINQS